MNLFVHVAVYNKLKRIMQKAIIYWFKKRGGKNMWTLKIVNSEQYNGSFNERRVLQSYLFQEVLIVTTVHLCL